MQELQSDRRVSSGNQILFPVAVAAVFLAMLVVGALVG